MKQLYSFLMLVFAISGFSQVPDASVTNCNSATKSLHSTLGTGKVLMIVSEGFDCVNCQNSAPGLQSFAAQNAGGIEVWAAMTYTYNANATPACPELDNWVSNYGWTDIFAFIDAQRNWLDAGTPRYYVYSPQDTTLAYAGFNKTSAFDKAKELATTVSLKENGTEEFAAYWSDGLVQVNFPDEIDLKVQLLNLTGKVIKETTLRHGNRSLSTSGMSPGLYLLSVEGGRSFRAVRKLYIGY